MTMSEAKIKSDLTEYLRKRFPMFVILRLEDRYTHGIPDIAVWGNKIGSATEVKFATPHFKTKGVQELTLNRLARASFAWYTVYWEKAKERRTYIIQPKDIGRSLEESSNWVKGFNHEWVGDHIWRVHNGNYTV